MSLQGFLASEVQRKQWASATLKGRGRSTSAGPRLPDRLSIWSEPETAHAANVWIGTARRASRGRPRWRPHITSPSDPWDASAASQVPGRDPRQTCEATRWSRVVLISNTGLQPRARTGFAPMPIDDKKSARCPIECPNSAELVASKKKKIRLECGIADGETRTRTGDTTIFSRGPRSLELHHKSCNYGVPGSGQFGGNTANCSLYPSISALRSA
jgi:hypothetical protein